MTEFIRSLKDDHIVIMVLLQKIQKNTKLTIEERKSYLLTVKTLFNNHLRIEDEKLYPELKKMATANNSVIETVDEFTVGLDRIGLILTNFFNKSEKDLENIHRSSDYSKIIKLLEVRISKEEELLYPLYDVLIQG